MAENINERHDHDAEQRRALLQEGDPDEGNGLWEFKKSDLHPSKWVQSGKPFHLKKCSIYLMQ